jgi:hypothetical protein
MKSALLLLFALLPAVCFAQKDPCKKFRGKLDRKKGLLVYTSPELKHMTAIREFRSSTFFGLHLRLDYHHEMSLEKGATIVFSDGSKYRIDDVNIDCRQKPQMLSTSYSGFEPNPYLLQGFIPIDSSAYWRFRSKRITAVYLSDASALISEAEGDKMKQYIKCLCEVKP